MERIIQHTKQYWKQDSGAVSVEYSLWLVVMVVILMLAADASLLLSKHSELYDVSRDIARQLALGVITEADVQTVMQLRWPDTSAYVADVSTVDDFVVVAIRISFSDVLIFGDSFTASQVLEGRTVMAMENT